MSNGEIFNQQNSRKILFVEDEVNLLNSLSFILENEGYTVTRTSTGEDAITLAEETSPDVILLDIMLPGIDGFEVAMRLKKNKKTAHILIIMLTGREVEEDIIKALENYADDYVTKPVKPRMLIARINAVLRRKFKNEGSENHLSAGQLRMDIVSRQAWIDNEIIEMTKSEFDILSLLIKEPNKVFSRTQIINHIRGEDYFITERSIDFQIFGLRKRLGNIGNQIETVRGIGYKFKTK